MSIHRGDRAVEQRGKSHPGGVGRKQPGRAMSSSRLVSKMKSTITPNRATMMTKASQGICAPKNIGDQSQFRIIWPVHQAIALLFGARVHKRHPAVPIRT